MPKSSSRRSRERSPWTAADVAPEDLETAKREALLQLRIGRSAHLSAVFVSAALAVDALLLLFLYPVLPTLGAHETGGIALAHSFYILLLIAGGLVVSAAGVVTKWEAFQTWPWEGHFAVSVGALALNAAVAVAYGARLAGAGGLGRIALYPGFIPLALAGTSVALLGIVATWTPWGYRQWTSAVAAAAPVPTTLLLYVRSIVSSTSSEALGVALLVSAILYQTSGSFLHLVSSGTGAHQDAVVLSGQNRIVRLAGELQQREEATRFREAALVKREADAEAAEGALRRTREAELERAKRLEALELGQRAQAESFAERERDLAGREAALETQGRLLGEKAKDVGTRTEELARRVAELASREQKLARREGEVAGKDVSLRQRAQELDRRETAVRDGDARVAARRKEIDQKTAELLRREGEVTARERAGPAPVPGRGAVNVTDLAAREARLDHLKGLLDEQNVQLGRRSKEVAEQAKSGEAILRQVAERESHLAAREAALSQQETDLQDRLRAADERHLQYETAARDYERRLDEVGRLQVEAAKRSADLDRSLQSLVDREGAVASREAAIRSASDQLDRRESDVVLRERSLDADEAEVSLRRERMDRESDLPFAGLLAVAAADRADSGPAAGRPGRGRRGRPVLDAQQTATSDTGTLAAPSGRKYPDRLPTGTPRLDDLLLGGLPPKSHTALVGPAFVGKEVALYAFIAEGLKRSEPAVLVTASRSRAEIAESLGVVLPQFREYEQMGSVRWIDASGGGGAVGPGQLIAKGSDDHAGILTALVQAAKQAEEQAKGGDFRVGFLGLSAALAHADERASLSFLQNVVGILKPRAALAMYALEPGALSEAQVESLLGRMDGAIVFRQERDRTFLAVKGFGDVATRDWVEVRATARALIVGSFALERIR